MSLQFILGASGSGKSSWLYHCISREAAKNPEKNYIVLVPDQFTLETQKTLVEISGCGGILNIDVLSFHRLAYRVFEEIPAIRKTVLEDMGKMMLLRKVLSEQKDHLLYFRRGLYKTGFLDECKSFLCELTQYAVTEEDFQRMEELFEGQGLVTAKLKDIRLIYRSLQEKMGDTYMMAEELLPQLTAVAASVPVLQDSVICLDGFTGFTPTQYELLKVLMGVCQRMMVTVTTDRTGRRDSLFQISKNTIEKLSRMASQIPTEIEKPVITGKGKEKRPYRTAGSDALNFLEQQLFSYTGKKWNSKTEDIAVCGCQRESDEASYVAEKIRWLVREKGIRYDEIAVVSGDVNTYGQLLSREMERMGIRYFIDSKKNIGANALAEYLVSFLEMYRRNMDYESTFRFLRCGLSPLTKEETDLLENYVLARGRRGIGSYRKEWQYAVKRVDLVLVNEYRKKLVDAIEKTYSALRGGKKTVREFTEILYRLVVESRLYERLLQQSKAFEEEGELILAKEYRGIYRMVMELMDELVTLLGTETVTFSEYEELLKAGLSEGLMGFVPPESNQVVIGDVERSRLKDIRVLFFVGVNDEWIPKKQGSPGILSESERKRIAEGGVELAPTPEEQSATDQFYLYLTLTKPAERLYLTYSKMAGDGSSKRPSYLLQQIHKMFPALSMEKDKDMTELSRILGTDRGRSYFIEKLAKGDYREDLCWWELASYYQKQEPQLLPRLMAAADLGKEKSRISKEAARLLYGDEIFGSVTRLERFAACPYAHYIVYGLGLKEREKYDVDFMDCGNIFHRAMEHFSHALEKRETTWQELKEEEALALAEDSVEYAVRDYRGEKFFQSRRTEFVVGRMKRMLKSAVGGMWMQMREGKFLQQDSEEKFLTSFDLENGKKMALQGVIDRIDVCRVQGESHIKLVDYKTGDNRLALDSVYYGLQLQLVLYMQAALQMQSKRHPEQTPIPAAMLYYRIFEASLEWKNESEQERRQRELGAFCCRGYVNQEKELLGELDRNLLEGGELCRGFDSQIIPVKVNTKENKEGRLLSASSAVMSTGQFEKLMRHTEKKVKEFGSRIYEGEIRAAPFQMAGETACGHCRLQGVCGVEAKFLHQCVRELSPMKDEEVWEVLDEQDSVD